MDRETLRARQKPLRDRYLADARTAWTPLRGRGEWLGDDITCTVQTWAGPVRAGLHPATGGDGSDACSGDMLMQALAGCAGTTARSVATALGLQLGRVEVEVRSHFDARGTLGVDSSVPVGIGPVTVTIVVDADLDARSRERLTSSTGRYCVVGRSLLFEPTYEVRTR